jgi:hypothetical protein
MGGSESFSAKQENAFGPLLVLFCAREGTSANLRKSALYTSRTRRSTKLSHGPMNALQTRRVSPDGISAQEVFADNASAIGTGW